MRSYYNSVQLQRTPLFVINISMLELIGTLLICIQMHKQNNHYNSNKRDYLDLKLYFHSASYNQ